MDITNDPEVSVYYELGKRQVQVDLLRTALFRFGRHADHCPDGGASGGACECGFRDALTIGADIRAVLGLEPTR